MHHSADPPEVDEKFSELLSRELSRRAPPTSRKFRDVNAIALREWRWIHRADSPLFARPGKFIGPLFREPPRRSVDNIFIGRVRPRTTYRQRSNAKRASSEGFTAARRMRVTSRIHDCPRLPRAVPDGEV